MGSLAFWISFFFISNFSHRPILLELFRLSSFSREGYKFRQVFGYKSIFQNETIVWTDVCRNLTFKVSFLCQKWWESFQKKNFIEEYQFKYTFFIINFWQLQHTSFSNMMPIFDNSLLHQFTKYNIFILIFWFQAKT